MVEGAKEKGVHVHTFDASSVKDTPRNVYVEKTPDGPFMWWTTEDGQTIGKEEIAETNEFTGLKSVQGERYTVPFDEAIAKKIKSLASKMTKYLIKDGATTTQLQNAEEYIAAVKDLLSAAPK
jgi:hypothetical protein